MSPALISNLDLAYRWLCQQRQHYPANADVWDLRFHWNVERPILIRELRTGHFQLGPMQVLTQPDGEVLHLWRSRDALVLKALTLTIQPRLRVSSRCVHVKGHGGLKAAVREVQQRLPGYHYVLRTDVKGYYEHIDHQILLAQLARAIREPPLRELLHQAIAHTVERGGLYWDIRQGISRGCPLSPLLGALYLLALVQRFSRVDVYYVRYMDDILVLAKTHWQLRRAVRVVNRSLTEHKLGKHPDKTFIGRIERGFDFLGYHFSRGPLQLAAQTVQKHVSHLRWLYEQQTKKKVTSKEVASVLGAYVKRWRAWCRAGLSDSETQLDFGLLAAAGCGRCKRAKAY